MTNIILYYKKNNELNVTMSANTEMIYK